MTEVTNPCYLCNERPAFGPYTSGLCARCIGNGGANFVPPVPPAPPSGGSFELAWVAHRGQPPENDFDRALFGLLREFWEAGAAQVRGEFSDAGERAELRELVRSAQHHVDRSWPQCNAWLERAYQILGRDAALSGTPKLQPQTPATKEQPPNEDPKDQREH